MGGLKHLDIKYFVISNAIISQIIIANEHVFSFNEVEAKYVYVWMFIGLVAYLSFVDHVVVN